MDGMHMMILQLLQNMGLNPDELIQTVHQFKTVAIELVDTQKRIEEKLDLIISHNNLMPQTAANPLIEVVENTDVKE